MTRKGNVIICGCGKICYSEEGYYDHLEDEDCSCNKTERRDSELYWKIRRTEISNHIQQMLEDLGKRNKELGKIRNHPAIVLILKGITRIVCGDYPARSLGPIVQAWNNGKLISSLKYDKLSFSNN